MVNNTFCFLLYYCEFMSIYHVWCFVINYSLLNSLMLRSSDIWSVGSDSVGISGSQRLLLGPCGFQVSLLSVTKTFQAHLPSLGNVYTPGLELVICPRNPVLFCFAICLGLFKWWKKCNNVEKLLHLIYVSKYM